MTHACPAAHLGLEMWENEGNAYHVYTQLSFGRQFLFIVFFLFAYQTYQQQYVAALLPIGSSLSLTDAHTHTYTYIWKPELTLYDVSWSSGLFFYKEYGSFVEKIPWRRRIESKYM